MNSNILDKGEPLEQGAVICNGGVNFTLFSRSAASVTLCLFDSEKDKEPASKIVLDPRRNRTGGMWHVFVGGIGAGALYLYLVDGPNKPSAGYRFNKNKYILDPYSKAFTRGSIFRSYNKQREAGLLGLQKGMLHDLSDFPKCVVVDDSDFDWQGDKPLETPLEESVIYEAHLKGYTQSSTSGVSAPGTYRGIVEKIEYLRYIGVTAVELLPVFEFDGDENMNLNPRTGERLTNYWGYSTIGFFAPKMSYSSDLRPGACVREFKEMVRELHKAGIEVLLDVVYNHTAEGNERGTTYMFRGLENDVYYSLPEGHKEYYNNFSGCGNSLNCNHPVVRNFILESLRHWVKDMHVDGFRFDLASVLCRSQTGQVLKFPPVTNAIAEDPILSSAKIIAEPWDAAGAYHVGSFPGGVRWCEWNGRFRDDIRRFIRGDEGAATDAATRLAGSSDLYKADGRRPINSINFVTCHDGFTLNDIVSYNYKHNDENGEDNRDGSNDNFSYNNGFEGESTNPKIVSVRERKVKNFFVALMTAQGVPMFLAGDEMMHTQRGNNNAYCQDSDISWINWHDCDRHPGILRFVRKIIQFRKAHCIFRRREFFDGTDGSDSIVWLDREAKNPDWAKIKRFLAFHLTEGEGTGGKTASGIDAGGGGREFYVAFNTNIYDATVKLPTPRHGKWHRIIDTSYPAKEDIVDEGEETGSHYVMIADSAVVLMAK